MTDDVIRHARRATRRRATLLLVAGIVLVTLTGLLWTAIHRPHRAGLHPTPATTAVASVASGPSLAVLPADVSWVQVDGVSLPVSAQVGPRDSDRGLARGFAHTAGGALLAAVHLLVRVSPQVGPDVFDPTLDQQVIGPDAASMRAQVLAQYRTLLAQAQLVYGQPVGRLYATLRGYLVDTYTPGAATLRILTQTQASDGSPIYVDAVVCMQWAGADWALVAPPGGNWQQAITAVTAQQAAVFTPFPTGR